MAAPVETILDAMVAVIAAAHTHVDLSGDDQVRLGEAHDHAGAYGASDCVYLVAEAADVGTQVETRAYSDDWRVVADCWAQSAGDDTTSIHRAALRIASDVEDAVRTSFLTAGSTLNTTLHRLQVSVEVAPQLGGAWGRAWVTLTFSYTALEA